MNEIKGWRERAGLSPDYQLTCPSAVEKAMEAEIAERKKQNEELLLSLRALHDVVVAKNRDGADWGALFGPMLAALARSRWAIEAEAQP